MKAYPFFSHDQEAEQRRLSLIQDSFDDKSKQHLLKAGLKKGLDCLELGVGAGSIASWMKEEVGKEGSVLGIDLNTSLIKEPIEYDLLEGDILELEIEHTFDLIHLRYVLIHNKNSKDILNKLFSLLRTDGKIVIEEPDFTLAKWMDAKEIDSCKRVSSALCKMFENRGLKPHYGSTMHLGLEEVGFEIDVNRSYLHLCSGKDSVAQVMLSSARALSKEYLDTRACSEEDIKAYMQACEDTESLAVYYATIVVTAIKKALIIEGEKQEGPHLLDGIYEAQTDKEILDCFELMHELRTGLDKEYFLKQVKEQINEGYHLFYMLEEASVVALCGCRIGKSLAWGKYLYIEDLVTTGIQRSLGYGKKILDHLTEFSISRGCEQVHLDSGVQRFDAHKFYLREGFKIASHHFSKS